MSLKPRARRGSMTTLELHARIVQEVRASPLASAARLAGYLRAGQRKGRRVDSHYVGKVEGACQSLVRKGVLVAVPLPMGGVASVGYDVRRACDGPMPGEAWGEPLVLAGASASSRGVTA